jgi:hypothetical protein
MIELQTSVKQDDTTRTRTPKPGYLNLSNDRLLRAISIDPKKICGAWYLRQTGGIYIDQCFSQVGTCEIHMLSAQSMFNLCMLSSSLQCRRIDETRT